MMFGNSVPMDCIMAIVKTEDVPYGLSSDPRHGIVIDRDDDQAVEMRFQSYAVIEDDSAVAEAPVPRASLTCRRGKTKAVPAAATAASVARKSVVAADASAGRSVVTEAAASASVEVPVERVVAARDAGKRRATRFNLADLR